MPFKGQLLHQSISLVLKFFNSLIVSVCSLLAKQFTLDLLLLQFRSYAKMYKQGLRSGNKLSNASFIFFNNSVVLNEISSVTCISLAAKVEENQVPLLLDLQVEDAKYVFESKTIQRMELLILSTLNWKMHPVTPLSAIEE
ncbi:hypothetical protein HN51_062755 [Arachis hypogaea]